MLTFDVICVSYVCHDIQFLETNSKCALLYNLVMVIALQFAVLVVRTEKHGHSLGKAMFGLQFGTKVWIKTLLLLLFQTKFQNIITIKLSFKSGSAEN